MSIFGPGFGESIVLHQGDGIWLAIDSCIHVESGECAPLKYLRDLGVDVATQVAVVAATHWHSDHVRGISQLFDASESADFVCSVALHSREFLTLVAAEETDVFLRSPGLDELRSVFMILSRRGKSPLWAVADRALWRDVLFSLSPSDAAVEKAIRSFADLIPQTTSTKRRVPSGGGNDFTVAMWMTTGDDSVLLGADLEEQGRANEGWTAVLASTARPKGLAAIYKVAHHGSADAHHDGIWQQLLSREPQAVVAPWLLGGGVLPADRDVNRICALSLEGHLTARPQRPARARHDPRVERLIKDTVRYIHNADKNPGQVRLRKPKAHAAEWEIEYFRDAYRMCGSPGR